MIRKLTPTLVLLAALAGCATTPPVQEMSDARQALRAAADAGAVRITPKAYAEAESLLEEAQRQLEAGAYGTARRLALDARDEAIRAREQAITVSP